MYYTVIKHDGHLRTRGKCRQHEPQASVFYISRVFSNARRVLSQCNTRLRLLYLLNICIYIYIYIYVYVYIVSLQLSPLLKLLTLLVNLSTLDVWKVKRRSPRISVLRNKQHD